MKKTGFTLIELLIVIVIIGIIATFGVIALNQVRAKARDTQRLSDIKQVSTALELYRADENNYPTVITPGQPLVGPTSGITYVKSLPTNPLPTNDGTCAVNEYAYLSSNGGQSYQITYCLGQAVGEVVAGSSLAKPGNISSPVPGFTCGDAVSYGGESYATVLIGTQCWFARNLNIGTMIGSKLADNATAQNQTDNGTIEKFCYDYVQQGNAGQITTGTNNCNTYGGLYQWNEAMAYVTTDGAQGICPTGWHIPKDSEWTTLSTYLGGDTVSGGHLKEAGTTHWFSNTGGDNSSGFTALPGGVCQGGPFGNSTYFANIWTSTLYSGTESYYRNARNTSAAITNGNWLRSYGTSVRCLKD